MPMYEIVYRDEIEANSEDEAIEWLFQHLEDCVRNGDVTCFQFYKLKENQNA